MADKPLTKHRVAGQIALAELVARQPERRIPPVQLHGLGLTEQDVDDMRAGTWTAPDPEPDKLTVQIQTQVAQALAPVRDAVDSARESLQAFVDNPHPASVESTVQAVAAVTIAIADALPSDPAASPPDSPPDTPPVDTPANSQKPVDSPSAPGAKGKP